MAISDAERIWVQGVLLRLAPTPSEWHDLIRKARINPNTASAWKYGSVDAKNGLPTPSAPYLLRLLHAAGKLEAELLWPEGQEKELAEAERLATEAKATAKRTKRRPPGDRAKRGSG